MVMNLRVPFGVGSAWVPEERKELVCNHMSAESVFERMRLLSFNYTRLISEYLDGIGQNVPFERGTL